MAQQTWLTRIALRWFWRGPSSLGAAAITAMSITTFVLAIVTPTEAAKVEGTR